MSPWSDEGGHTTSPSKETTQHPHPKEGHIPAPHPHPDRARLCPQAVPSARSPCVTSLCHVPKQKSCHIPIQCPYAAPCAMSPCPVSGFHALSTLSIPIPTVPLRRPRLGAVPCPHAVSLFHTSVSHCHAAFGAMPPHGRVPSIPPLSALHQVVAIPLPHAASRSFIPRGGPRRVTTWCHIPR